MLVISYLIFLSNKQKKTHSLHKYPTNTQQLNHKLGLKKIQNYYNKLPIVMSDSFSLSEKQY